MAESSKGKTMNLAQHDRRFHPNGYREGASCLYRAAMSRGDNADQLEKAEKKERQVSGEMPRVEKPWVESPKTASSWIQSQESLREMARGAGCDWIDDYVFVAADGWDEPSYSIGQKDVEGSRAKVRKAYDALGDGGLPTTAQQFFNDCLACLGHYIPYRADQKLAPIGYYLFAEAPLEESFAELAETSNDVCKRRIVYPNHSIEFSNWAKDDGSKKGVGIDVLKDYLDKVHTKPPRWGSYDSYDEDRVKGVKSFLKAIGRQDLLNLIGGQGKKEDAKDSAIAKYLALFGKPKTAQDESDLDKHDKRFHPNGYKDGDYCKYRESLAKGDDADRLADAEKTEGAQFDALQKVLDRYNALANLMIAQPMAEKPYEDALSQYGIKKGDKEWDGAMNAISDAQEWFEANDDEYDLTGYRMKVLDLDSALKGIKSGKGGKQSTQPVPAAGAPSTNPAPAGKKSSSGGTSAKTAKERAEIYALRDYLEPIARLLNGRAGNMQALQASGRWPRLQAAARDTSLASHIGQLVKSDDAKVAAVAKDLKKVYDNIVKSSKNNWNDSAGMVPSASSIPFPEPGDEDF